jgi:hypothetical protein
MRLLPWLAGSILFAAGWAGCVGDSADDGIVEPKEAGATSSASSSGSSSSSSSSSGSSSSSSSGGSTSSGGSSGSSSGEVDANVDCLGGAFVDGYCQPITLKANLPNPYGVTVVEVDGVTLAAWVRGAPTLDGAVERCNVAQCDASVTKIANIKGANGADAFDGAHPVSGRTIVSDGTSVRWIAHDAGDATYPKDRDKLEGCPLLGVGCAGPGSPSVLAFGPHAVSQLGLGGNTLFLRNSIGELAGCGMASCDVLGAGLDSSESYRRSIAADDGNVAWVSSVTTTVSQCTRDGAVCAAGARPTPASLDTFGNVGVSLLDLNGTSLVGATDTTVFACTRATCAATMSFLVKDQPTVSAVVTSGTAAYWAVKGSGSGSGDTGAIYTCPVAGCGANGPRRIAGSLADPRALSIHGGVLYWVSFGAAAITGSLQAVKL